MNDSDKTTLIEAARRGLALDPTKDYIEDLNDYANSRHEVLFEWKGKQKTLRRITEREDGSGYWIETAMDELFLIGDPTQILFLFIR